MCIRDRQKRVEQGTLPGGQDTLTKFEDMFISAYAVADHILRVAGPTRVSIRATRTVRVRPYPLRDKERFEACKLIIEDLLQRGVVKRCTSSPFRSPALVVSKKAKPGAPLQARYRFVMLRMLSAGCSINLAKSQFCLDANEGHEFLGVHVTGSGIRPSPRLVQGIVDMAVPKTLKDVRSCVGALNFHRRFIPAFAEKIHSLNKAICRGDDFKGLTSAEVEDFERLRAELKDIVQRKQQLYFVDLSKEIEVLTDASKNGLGAFLSLIHISEPTRPY